MTQRQRLIYCKQYIIAVCAIALLLLSACRDDSNNSVEPIPNEPSVNLQLRLHIVTTTDTRATGPKGGEDGDGREDGVNHENEINSALLLLYTTADGTGINTSSDAVTIEKAYSFSDIKYKSAQECYETEAVKVETAVLEAGYHILVVANSDLDVSEFVGKRLSDVRDYIVTNQWTAADDIADYTNFVMTSATDAVIEGLKGNGSATDPYRFDAAIERMAARIDFDTDGGTLTADGDCAYDVTAADGNADGNTFKFVLESVEAFNCVNTGAYLVKRVGNADAGDILYLGDETQSADNYATNYVICPYWTDAASRGYSTDLATAETEIETRGIGTPVTSQTYRIVAYTQENTTSDNDPRCSTGLLLHGTYYDSADWDTSNNKPRDGAVGVSKTFTYYIRHSDPDNKYAATTLPATAPDGVMTYGTVRNNIYRISISQVKNTVTAPTLSINVRKWATYKHSEIVM